MTKWEAREYLIGLSYTIGTIGVEYLSDKDAEKAREAIEVLYREEKKTFTPPSMLITETNIAYYDNVEAHENCTVQILTNTQTGEVSVGWWENE